MPYYASGNTERGIEFLDKAAASKDTVSYYASYYLGILHLKQGNKPLALNAFDYAKKNPKDRELAQESAFQFAKVSYDAGKPDQAISEFERYLKTYPSSSHSVEVKEMLAQAYVNGNNFNKAIEYIEALPSRNQYINQAYQKAAYLKGSELYNKENYPRSGGVLREVVGVSDRPELYRPQQVSGAVKPILSEENSSEGGNQLFKGCWSGRFH